MTQDLRRPTGAGIFGWFAHLCRQILSRAQELEAGAIVIGPEARQGPLAAPVAALVTKRARADVIVLHPEAGALGRPLQRLAAGSR
jgi:hypothetical protein